MIVPDYFEPIDTPKIKELCNRLEGKNFQVSVFASGDTLKESRDELEHRCAATPFDIVVAFGTGCLLTGRITNSIRVYVDPDWTAWEWMKKELDNEDVTDEDGRIGKTDPYFAYQPDKDEVEMARQMAEPSYIRKGDKPVYGWFTEENPETHLLPEHLRRFDTGNLVPGFNLDTDRGISILTFRLQAIVIIENEDYEE